MRIERRMKTRVITIQRDERVDRAQTLIATSLRRAGFRVPERHG